MHNHVSRRRAVKTCVIAQSVHFLVPMIIVYLMKPNEIMFMLVIFYPPELLFMMQMSLRCTVQIPQVLYICPCRSHHTLFSCIYVHSPLRQVYGLRVTYCAGTLCCTVE